MMRLRKNIVPPGERGFTLIEMLVALSVFSLAALSLIRLQAYTTHNAQSVVRTRAVEVLTDPRPPALGEESGTVENGGWQWQWVQEAKLTEDQRFIQVDISAREKGSGATASLIILRPSGLLLDEPQADLPAG